MVLSTIGRALAELADSWTLLILQRAFLGVRRFAGWRDQLGIWVPELVAALLACR